MLARHLPTVPARHRSGTPLASFARHTSREKHVTMRARAGRRWSTAAAAAITLVPRFTWAHPGAAPEPHDAWGAWSWEPTVLVGIALAAWLYARGVRALWRRAGHGRGVAPWRAGCYAVGLLALVAALVSPVDAMGEALFTAHMVQHLLLVMVAAPLLVLGEPITAVLWAIPRTARSTLGRGWRRAPGLPALWRGASRPTVAWTLHVATLWAWHAPGPYEAAVRQTGIHVLEHATFFVTALLFWLPLADRRARRRLGLGGATLYLFAAMLQSTALGALLATSTQPWYGVYLATTGPWGLTPLEDQQLAGLIMWIPAGLVFLVALVAEFAVALREPTPRRSARTVALTGARS
jgi:cytochrome c oxidase assembly factor CtaG